MKRNRKRGWLKFSLATTLAFVFMAATAVTTLANTTITVEATPYGVAVPGVANHQLALDLNVDFDDVGLSQLWFTVNWDETLLDAAPPIVRAGEGMMDINQPSPVLIAAGDIRLAFEEPLTANTTQDGTVGRIVFTVADDADVDAAVTFGLGAWTGSMFVDGDGNEQPVPLDSFTFGAPATFSIRHIRWGFYNASETTQAFIAHAIGAANPAWVDFFYGQVVPAVRALPGQENATGAEALVMLNRWIAASAE